MYALIHNSQLILGPIGYNYRLINSELEDLEVEGRVSPRDYENIPIHITTNTHLLPVSQIIPAHDSRFQEIGNFSWNIVKQNGVPIRVDMTYPVGEKSLDKVKREYRQQLAPVRREKENTIIQVDIDGVTVRVPTSREERSSFVNKLMASPNRTQKKKFRFSDDLWLDINPGHLEKIIQEIDTKVQEAFDWEYSKIQEINACTTREQVYNVVIREPSQPPI